MTLTRKEFLVSLARGVGLATAGAALLAACGDGTPTIDARLPRDSNNGPPDAKTPDAAPPDAMMQASCVNNGTSITVSSNHHDTLTVPKADVVAGAQKMYTLTGGGHTHTVTISAAQFTMLQSNTSVTITSTNGGGHTHSVTVSCA